MFLVPHSETWHRAGNPQSAPCIHNRIQINETTSNERKLGIITAREARTETGSRADGGARPRAEGPGDGGHGAGRGRRHAEEPRSRRQSRDAARGGAPKLVELTGRGRGGFKSRRVKGDVDPAEKMCRRRGNREGEWGRRKSMGRRESRTSVGLSPVRLWIRLLLLPPSSQLCRRRATLLACKGFGRITT